MDESWLTQAMTAFRRAVAAAGGQPAFSAETGLKQQTISYRLRNDIPLKSAHEVLTVEAAFGISRHDLRPDIFPRDRCFAQDCPEHRPDIYPLETPATATGGAPDPELRPSASGAQPSEPSRKGLDMPPSGPSSTGGGTPFASSGMTSADPSRGLLADSPREGCVSGWQA